MTKKTEDSTYTSLQPPTTGNRGVEEDQRYTSMPLLPSGPKDQSEDQLKAMFGRGYKSSQRYSEEPVLYEVKLKQGVDGHKVKNDLEALASDLNVHVLDLKSNKMQIVNGKTSQETYESLFGTELRYVTREIPNLNKGPRDIKEWVELKTATVPVSLQDRIEHIGLVRMMYLTD